MNWYTRIDGQEYGPVTVQQLQQWAMESRILATTLVRQGESGNWRPASQVQGLVLPPPQQIPSQQIPQAQPLNNPSTPQSTPVGPSVVTTSSGSGYRKIKRRGGKSSIYDFTGTAWGCLILAVGIPGLIVLLIKLSPDLAAKYTTEMRAQIMIFGAVLAPIYLLPTIIAAFRKHVNTVPLFIIQLLLGWTVIVWCLCLAWSFSGNVESRNPRQR